MSGENKFFGWLGLDKSAVEGNMKWQEYTPKPFDEENDVEIKVQYCGICGYVTLTHHFVSKHDLRFTLESLLTKPTDQTSTLCDPAGEPQTIPYALVMKSLEKLFVLDQK